MRLFQCQNCSQVLFFDNENCGRCGHRVGFVSGIRNLSALVPAGDSWSALADQSTTYKLCANADWQVCNWLIPVKSDEKFCLACRHNRIIPDLSILSNRLAWTKLEAAKHRLFYTLLHLQLPTPNRWDEPANGLAFDFLSDVGLLDGQKVMTGHEDGLITVSLAEADDAEREMRRARFGENYRTLLGHFRHEVGHFYWDMLIRNKGRIQTFRATFGDETRNYTQALARHYSDGPAHDWQTRFVSAYAGSHPWEDWAETWAHYLHIIDGLETAEAFGLQIHPHIDPDHVLQTGPNIDVYGSQPFAQLVQQWLPMTIALNAMNQSMGLGDLYPFILSETVISKLAYIHDVIRDNILQDNV